MGMGPVPFLHHGSWGSYFTKQSQGCEWSAMFTDAGHH